MGTWSTESFGNDDALDWFADLREAANPFALIRDTLQSGATEQQVAAAAVLAVLAGGDHADVHPEVSAWCRGKPVPPAALKQLAVETVQAVLDDPEADGHDTWAELGEDDEDYIAWLAGLRLLQTRLQ